MGSVYLLQRKPEGAKKFKRVSKYYRIAYKDMTGKRVIENTKCVRIEDAKDILKLREGDLAHGLPVTMKAGKIRLDAALKLHADDLKANGKKSEKDAIQRHAHLLAFFPGARLLATIGLTELRAYVTHRQDQKAASATINRELAAVRRAYYLAHESGDVMSVPAKFPMMEENNVRKGFFEREQFEQIREKLPECLRFPVTLAYWTGWRVPSEILPLEWRQVDRGAGIIRLEVGETKSGDGREFHFGAVPELRRMFTEEWDAAKGLGTIPRQVFRRDDGGAITKKELYPAWKIACEAAGYPGKQKQPHDFRRTAVRNLNRAGVAQNTAMHMVGHKTQSIYKRYSIKDSIAEREGAEKLAAYVAASKADERKAGRVHRMKKRA